MISHCHNSGSDFNVWETLINSYLSQNDIVSSVITLNKNIHQLCLQKLYKSIKISCYGYRSLSSDAYGFKHTFLNGHYSKGETSHKEDQSDHILYVKMSKLLMNNLKPLSENTNSLTIEEDNFFDREHSNIIVDLIKAISNTENNLKFLHINDPLIYDVVFDEVLLDPTGLMRLENITIKSLGKFKQCKETSRFASIDVLELSNITEPTDIDFDLTELKVLDTETLFNINLDKNNTIQRLTFTLHHDPKNDHLLKNCEQISLLDAIQWNNITQLEIKYNCLMREFYQCSCLQNLLISKKNLIYLDKLSDLTLTQSLRDYKSNDLRFEMNQIPVLSNWDDIFILIFLKIPIQTLSHKLSRLSIKQYPSMNGHAKNITDGYYTHRVKKLLKLQNDLFTQATLMSLLLQVNITPFESLQVLQLPHFLQSLVQIPILSNDLLWNGCQCSRCGPKLEMIDKYLHNHLWFRQNISNSGGFGSGVSDKFQELENGEMFAFMLLPIDRYCEDLDSLIDGNGLDICWDFHDDLYNGSKMQLIHYEDDHHSKENCRFSELDYDSLVLHSFKHFLDLYIDYFLFNFPKIKMISLSGFVYRVNSDTFGSFLLYD